uniref:Myomesin 3 n=1 Tax=Oreochromis niloticus TaxID=8128 RepID=A0A669C976_ORENI
SVHCSRSLETDTETTVILDLNLLIYWMARVSETTKMAIWHLLVQGWASAHMRYLEQLSQKAPDFPIPLRAHTVWEGMTVKLSCTVQGCPTPKSALDGLFRHFCLYRPCVLTPAPFLPSLLALQEARFGTSFPPTWVKEGDTLTLECTFTSALLLFQKDVSWFIYIAFSKNKVHQVWGLSISMLFFFSLTDSLLASIDASAAVVGGPASPLAVQVSDVNKDYVFLTWQPPSADGASPVQGYYVERCDLGQGEWVRCNVDIQKMCHYPVFGLKEGTLYQFRVRSVNQAGAGRPSKATKPVLTADPLEHTRTMVVTVDRGRTITITKDELEGRIKAPFPPTNVHACEVSDTYVVLSWTEPEPRGREPLTFYVERSLTGKNSWEMVSLDMVVNSPRFPVFDLVKGKQYYFRVRSVNKYGVSDPSEPSTPISFGKSQAVPAPPHSVMAIRDTDTSVLLQWQEPKDKNGILGYYLYYSEAGKHNWKTINNKPFAKTRFTVHGLKTRKDYVFRVKCVSRAGNSSYSDESQPIMVKSAIYVPSAPSAIVLLLCTGSEMVLGWRAPFSDGGSPVRGYYLDQKEKGMEIWREVNVKPVKERQFKVCNLTSGHFYQFRVFAANVVGIGKPSEPSEAFLCEKWTMPEPGCPYDLEIREVRNGSLVLLWAAPLYEGRSPVTGYLLEISQGDQSENWTALSEKTISDTRYKVSGLQVGETYRFRVSAINEAGVGRASLPSEPVIAQTQPGTKNIEIGVDDDGFIFLGYEAAEMNDESKFLWSKNYTDPIGAERARAETKTNRSVLTFTDPSEEDLGLYTVNMSDNPQQSSSYDFTAEGKVVNLQAPLSAWQVEVSEKGSVRLWLQTESLSNAAELRLIFNDREISSTPHRKINFDKAKGLVEILFDQLSQEDEGSYTAQLRDGRAKNQFTLVFVDKKFRDTLALADAIRHDNKRKTGPYFQEFLSWSVNEDCELIMNCVGMVIIHLKAMLISCSVPRILMSLSASSLKIQSTGEGFKLYCSLKYYISFLKTSCSMQKVWIEIFNPTENDKGKYTLEMFDGKDTHKRFLDLSGQAFDDALLEHQRLNYFCLFVSDRAKVTKGLPDVVAIMEGKSLCLTCYIDGEPAPEIFWLRNDREIFSQDHFTITKVPKCSSITINNVNMEDSGKYSIFVRNKHGSETVDVTVSVYKHGEKPPANAVELS